MDSYYIDLSSLRNRILLNNQPIYWLDITWQKRKTVPLPTPFLVKLSMRREILNTSYENVKCLVNSKLCTKQQTGVCLLIYLHTHINVWVQTHLCARDSRLRPARPQRWDHAESPAEVTWPGPEGQTVELLLWRTVWPGDLSVPTSVKVAARPRRDL